MRVTDIKAIKIAGRAMVYGFARMKIGGHFPRWGVADEEAGQMAETIISLFVDGLKQP